MAGGFLSMLGGMGVTLLWQSLGNPLGLKPMLVALPASFLLFLIGNMIGKPIDRNAESVNEC